MRPPITLTDNSSSTTANSEHTAKFVRVHYAYKWRLDLPNGSAGPPLFSRTMMKNRGCPPPTLRKSSCSARDHPRRPDITRRISCQSRERKEFYSPYCTKSLPEDLSGEDKKDLQGPEGARKVQVTAYLLYQSYRGAAMAEEVRNTRCSCGSREWRNWRRYRR